MWVTVAHFHGPVILPYILKTIWCMNIILWDYESEWHDIWPQNKCKSLWPIFHGPVILPYILKTIWYMNTILWDCKSVWPNVWPKVFVAHCDLYFMVEWFCLISWKLFSDWTSYFGIMSRYDPTCDLQINVGHCDLYFMVHCICPLSSFILKTVLYMNIILSDYESVWHDIWPGNKCRSLWPIFHGPVILPYILNSIWWMNVILLEKESVQYDLWPQNKFRSQWSIFHGPVISLLFFALKNILVLLAKPDSGELRCPATALIILAANEDMHKISDEFKFRPGRTTDYGVSCPWTSKKFPIDL